MDSQGSRGSCLRHLTGEKVGGGGADPNKSKDSAILPHCTREGEPARDEQEAAGAGTGSLGLESLSAEKWAK